MSFKCELGQFAKDEITGFYGVVTQRCDNIDGTKSCCLTSTDLKDGHQVYSWVDEGRLRVDADAQPLSWLLPQPEAPSPTAEVTGEPTVTSEPEPPPEDAEPQTTDEDPDGEAQAEEKEEEAPATA